MSGDPRAVERFRVETEPDAADVARLVAGIRARRGSERRWAGAGLLAAAAVVVAWALLGGPGGRERDGGRTGADASADAGSGGGTAGGPAVTELGEGTRADPPPEVAEELGTVARAGAADPTHARGAAPRPGDPGAGSSRPSPPTPARSGVASAPVVPAPLLAASAEARALASPDTPRADLTSAGVALLYRGAGTLAGGGLAWHSGEVAVEVPPDRGLAFTVDTAEGRVRVLGTGFTVRRDALGTRVAVRHGRVSVRCGEAPEAVLGPGQERTCLPRTPAGLLGRARALRAQDPAAAAAATDAALAVVPPGPVATELRYLAADLALERGDRSAARAAVDHLRASGPGPRWDDATRLAARLAAENGECASARALVAELVHPRPDDTALVDACSARRE